MVRFGMLASLWIAGGAIFYLLAPSDVYSSPKFQLTLGTLLFASALPFCGGILRRNAADGSAESQADLGGYLVSLIYAGVVCVLALIALVTSISLKVLAVLHILALLPLIWGWLFMTGIRGSVAGEGRSVRTSPANPGYLVHRQDAKEIKDEPHPEESQA